MRYWDVSGGNRKEFDAGRRCYRPACLAKAARISIGIFCRWEEQTIVHEKLLDQVDYEGSAVQTKGASGGADRVSRPYVDSNIVFCHCQLTIQR